MPASKKISADRQKMAISHPLAHPAPPVLTKDAVTHAVRNVDAFPPMITQHVLIMLVEDIDYVEIRRAGCSRRSLPGTAPPNPVE